jgi:hypothetical protein
LRFPRRPGTEPSSAHGDGCPCCSPAGRVSQDNRASLSHFNYRIGTYGSIREYLFHQINRTPELLNWTHRTPDDPAVALLEGAAILGDILAFYQDTYANEAFLRTAKWRESVSDLVRLLGYRLSPAVGGEAMFAFEIKKDEPVVVPAGFPLKATLENIAKPAEFETTKEVIAYPWLSSFNLYAPLEVPGKFTYEFEIEEPKAYQLPVEIKVGDRLLIGESDKDWGAEPLSLTDAEIVIVDSIRELHGAKIFKVKGILKPRPEALHNKANIVAYRLGRPFHHFGYNSPARVTDPEEPVKTVVDEVAKTSTSTIKYNGVPFTRPVAEKFKDMVQPPIASSDFPLELEVQDLPSNVPIVIRARFGVEDNPSTDFLTLIRAIERIDPVTQTWGGISGTVSRLRFSVPIAQSVESYFSSADDPLMYIDDMLFYEVTSPLLKIGAARTPIGNTSGNALNFYGTASQVKILNGRRIMRVKKDTAPKLMDVSGVPGDFTSDDEIYPRLHRITLSESVNYVNFPQQDPVYTIYGNLAPANEGKTVPETSIGNGDATRIFQNFKLPKAPLTYHIVTANTPTETPEAEIYVDGRLWKKVDSFFGRDPGENVYIIREDTDGNSWVQFGDGKTGARLTSGTKNVTARYRVGDGAYGPLKADTKVQASAKLKNLDKIQMPGDVTGGAQPEDTENARNTAPGKVQSLGRIVSLNDFEFEALAIPGVASASVAWQLVENVPGVAVTILMEAGRRSELNGVGTTLSSYNTQRGAGRFPVEVKEGERLYTWVAVQYALQPTYREDIVAPAIRLALGVNYGLATSDEDQTGLFSLRRRRFGAAEYASSVEGWVQNVEGVLWAKTLLFAPLGSSDKPKTLPVPPQPQPPLMIPVPLFSPAVTCGSDQVLSLYNDHLILRRVAENGA